MIRPKPLPPVWRVPSLRGAKRVRPGAGIRGAGAALLIALILGVAPVGVSARPLRFNDPDYLADVWETEDELPDDTVSALAQTPDGYLWLGTPSGLVRFDGFRFIRFTTETSPRLPDNGVQQLWCDSTGRLWVGTAGGLCFRDGSGFSAITGAASAITSITEAEGTLWFSAAGGGVARLRGVIPVPMDPSPPAGFFSLVQDRGGDPGLWSVSMNGLARFEGGGWTEVKPRLAGDEARFYGACSAPEGGIWLATQSSLLLVHSNAVQRQMLRQPATEEPLAMLADSLGHVWTAGAASGLVRHSATGTDRTIRIAGSPLQDRILAMLEDREGGLWFGTKGGGAVRLKPRRFHTMTSGVSGALASLVAAAPNARLVSTAREGLGVLVANHPTVFKGQLNAVKAATCAIVTADGHLLLGSPDGLFTVAPGADPVPVALPVAGPVRVHQLALNGQAEVLVATSKGLFVLRDGHATAIIVPAGITGASRILVVGETAYVATLPTGLCVLRDGRLEPAVDDPGTAPGLVTALAAGLDDRVWFSGPECRLGSLRNRTVQAVSNACLPAVASFTCIVADGAGTLWLGSKNGLFRLSTADLSNPVPAGDNTAFWTRFDTKDGLASSKIRSAAFVLGPTGDRPLLCIGTKRGLNTADPAILFAKSQRSRPVIESLIAYEPADPSGPGRSTTPKLGSIAHEHVRVLPLGPHVPVPDRCHRIEVGFTAVDFDAPERIHFRYRLLGLDEEWTELADRSPITFHALPAGSFNFQLKASNSDGVWSDEIASVGFVIAPAFWQAAWFRVLLGLGALGGVSGLFWNASRSHSQRQDEMVEQQRHLAREKARLASVLETTSDVVAFADPDLRIFYLNPAGCRTLEVPAPSLDRSLPFDSILAIDSIPRFHEEAVPAAILRGVWSGEFALQSDSARSLLVSQVMLCHKRADGSLDFFSFVMRDLSPIKEAEARHEKLEAQLRQAQKMEAVGLLAGGVAHDFNNILQVILGHSSIALEKAVPPADRENSLIEVKKAARRAAQLTKQLLAFGRRQPLQKLHFDLNTLVHESLDMSRRLLGADIEIEFRPADEPAVIHADRGQIEQVMLNLMVNARDAMPRGGKMAFVITPLPPPSAAEGDTSTIGPLPSGPCVRIDVIDSGVGISPEHLPHIFEPFFTTKSKNKGSGLGLSVVYGIIQQHGGSLRIESTVGVGTTFRIYLPSAPGTVAAQRTTREIPVKRGSGTILVAEDEESVRLLATRVLQKAGYTVVAARDGEEAVALFRENNETIDLLLMDVIMPRLSGPEAVKQIRELDPEVPALYASGYGGEFLKADGRLDIDGEVLQKPYQPNELLDRISGYLRNPK